MFITLIKFNLNFVLRFWTSWRSCCRTWSLTCPDCRPAWRGSRPWPRGSRCPRGASSRGWSPRPVEATGTSRPPNSSPRGSREANCPRLLAPTLPSSGPSIPSPANPPQPAGEGEVDQPPPRLPSPAPRPLPRSNSVVVVGFICDTLVDNISTFVSLFLFTAIIIISHCPYTCCKVKVINISKQKCIFFVCLFPFHLSISKTIFLSL